MSEAARESNLLAGNKAPEAIGQEVMSLMQHSVVEFWRMIFNPMSYVPQPLVPLCLKACPWLSLLA